MRKVLLLLCCLLSLTLMGASNPAPDFRAMYDGYENAVRDMNVEGYMGYFSDDFRVTTPDGRDHSKAELTEAQRTLAKAVHVRAFEVTIESVTALAPGEFDVVVRQMLDRDQRTGAGSLNLRSSVVRHEIWRETDRGWKIFRIEHVLDGPTSKHVRNWI